MIVSFLSLVGIVAERSVYWLQSHNLMGLCSLRVTHAERNIICIFLIIYVLVAYVTFLSKTAENT